MSITANPDSDYLPEDDADETSMERLVGLTEMFPESLRNGVGKTLDFSVNSIKKLYGVSRTMTWVFFSTATLLMAPALFELERHQMEEMTKMQQRQMLLGPSALGPNAAYSPSPKM